MRRRHFLFGLGAATIIPLASRNTGAVLDNILGGLKVPVLYGLTIGHTNDQLTLPLGPGPLQQNM